MVTAKTSISQNSAIYYGIPSVVYTKLKLMKKNNGQIELHCGLKVNIFCTTKYEIIFLT